MSTDDLDKIHAGHCIDHRACTMKIGQLCRWKEEHDANHKTAEGQMRKDLKGLETKFDDRFTNHKNWLIGILVALCLNLIGIIGTGLVLITKSFAGG